MTTRFRTVIYLLLLATLCMGCGGHGHMRQLERLEAQLDTAPEAVRLALDSIPFASLGDEERALYAILRTQADYKCDLPLTTDTLIRHAVNYYQTSHPDYRAAMAHYSLGCVYTELGDNEEAIRAYLHAKTLFPDTTVRYHLLCNQNLGRHYMNKRMYKESMEAFMAFKNVANDADLLYADLNIASILIYTGKFVMAEDILKSLLEQKEELDSLYLSNIYFELGKIEYAYRCDYNKANDFFDLAIAYGEMAIIPLIHFFKGEIANTQKRYSEASYAYLQALQYSSDIYLDYSCTRELMYLSLDSTILPTQNHYVHQFEMLYDSISNYERRTEINNIHKEHEIEQHKQQATKRIQIIIILAVLFSTIIIAIILLYMLRKGNKQKQAIILLQNQLRNNQKELHALQFERSSINAYDKGEVNRVQVLDLYRKNLLLGEQLFRQSSRSKNLDRLTNTKEKDFSVMKNAERELIIQAIFDCFAESISNLHTESHGSLNPEEIITCILSAMHYRSNVIMICTLSPYSTHTSRKTRAKRKLPEDILPIFFPE